MIRKSSTDDSGAETYELVRHAGSSDGFKLVESSGSTLPQSNRALPPKRLAGTRFKRSIVLVVIINLVLVIAFSLAIFFVGTGIPWIGLVNIANDDSCDLETASGSSIQSAFTINIRRQTHLSFPEAKAVDVIWDLCIGQGGRFLLGWISYKVFMDGLLRVMEKYAVSYALYASVAFEPISAMSIWNTLMALSKTKSWRTKAFLVWFCVSTIYVLAFPTLISAGSGYVTASNPGFVMKDGSVVTASSDTLTACFNLPQGALIGLENGTIVLGPPVNVVTDTWNGTGSAFKNDPITNEKIKGLSSELFYTLYTYPYSPASKPMYLRANGSSSNRPDYTTQSGYDLVQIHGFETNITVKGHTYVFTNYTFRPLQTVCYQNQSLPEDLTSIAKCIPEQYFVWGWSSLLLYITLGLQLAWTLGMLGVWLDANINSQLCRKGRKVRGYFRAAADISEAMRETLGDEFCAYSESDIARELEKEHNGLRYYTSYVKDSGDISHIGISSTRRDGLYLRDDVIYGASTTGRR